jgi:hypothetical protein
MRFPIAPRARRQKSDGPEHGPGPPSDLPPYSRAHVINDRIFCTELHAPLWYLTNVALPSTPISTQICMHFCALEFFAC